MKDSPRIFNLVLVFVMLFSVLGFMPQPVEAQTADLFFSEYIEGSSNNKALEIYNGTGGPVDLMDYKVVLYSNGSVDPGNTLEWDTETILADGDVYIIANSRADTAITDIADIISTVTYYNGNDVVALQKTSDDSFVDVLGTIGDDSDWGAEMTLIRKETICSGDTDPTDPFDPATEWDVYAQNYFDDLGTHTAYCEMPSEPVALVINEFSASTTGTDVEYVEIYGNPNTDYSDYTILEVEGDSNSTPGVIDEVIPVGTTDAYGLFLADLPANTLENGTISLLLVRDFTAQVGFDLDPQDNGTLHITPWKALVDSVAVNDGDPGDYTYGTTELYAYYDDLPYPPGGASRIPDGHDTDLITDWVRNDFDLGGIPGYEGSLIVGEAFNTPGEPNLADGCGVPYTPIYDIQGDGMSTPLYGEKLVTEGIVVGDFQEGGKNGFFMQDALGDGDPSTSDGIFVYAPSTIDVNLGDHVRVRGTATEYYNLTQIGSVRQVYLCDSGLPLPEPAELTLPAESIDDYEPFEGMYITFPQDLVISEYYNFDRYGEIVLTSERHLTPTAFVEPGEDAIAVAEAYTLDSITLDDGRTSQNPDPAIHPNGLEFTLFNRFRGGDLVTNLTGVLDYSFSIYRVQATEGADYTAANPRPESPDIYEGDIKIASMNVLNYFTTLDNAGSICGPSGDMGCRGADNATELERQRAKIIAAISAMDADVVGLIEIENDRPGPDPDYAAADLVAGLNDLMGADTYDYIATGAIGTDVIKNALIYKPASVTPVGDFAILDSTVDARFLDEYNRPALAQSFMDNAVGETVTVAVNHLKSKGSPCDAVGDPDLGDGAANCNLTRLAAAQAEVDWLATDPTGSGVEHFLIIGDLNSYDKEDPIDAIKAGSDDTLGTEDDYLDMIYEILGEDAYSYVFDGQVGYLDYVMVHSSLEAYVTDVDIWHINADEPDLIDYDTSYKKAAQDAIYAPDAYRSSDHDPVLITLTFNKPPQAVDDFYETDQDVTLVVPAPGVLPNDTDLNENDTFRVDVATPPMHGELVLNTEDGSFTYTPDPGFFGEDTFTYILMSLPTDVLRGEYSDTATVTINVIGSIQPNEAPVAMDQSVETDQDTPLEITLAATDPEGDALTFSIDSEPEHGMLVYEEGDLPMLTYDPDPGWFGEDSFTFIANDGALDSNIATVTITVNEIPEEDEGYDIFLPLISNN